MTFLGIERRTVTFTSSMFALFVFGCSNTFAEEATRFDIFKECDHILTRINDFQKINQLKPWDIDTMKGEVKRISAGRTGVESIILHRRSSFQFIFSSPSNKLMQVVNSDRNTEMTMIDGLAKRTFDEPVTQMWNSERATGIAHGFVVACVGEFPANLGSAHAEFTQWELIDKGKKPYGGYPMPYWRVEFPRIDEDGYRFQLDRISVNLFEEVGPYSINVEMYSEYKRVTNQPVGQSEVIMLALDRASASSRN